MKKALRTGKIFVDWSQNDDHKTTICVYSLRAKERPTVSTPVKWDEVESCLKKGDPTTLVFESDQVMERVEEVGDLFAPVLKLKQKLPPLAKLADIGELESGVGKSAAAKPRTASRRRPRPQKAAPAKPAAAKRTSRRKRKPPRLQRKRVYSASGRNGEAAKNNCRYNAASSESTALPSNAVPSPIRRTSKHVRALRWHLRLVLSPSGSPSFIPRKLRPRTS